MLENAAKVKTVRHRLSFIMNYYSFDVICPIKTTQCKIVVAWPTMTSHSTVSYAFSRSRHISHDFDCPQDTTRCLCRHPTRTADACDGCDRLRVQLAIQKVATLANDKSRDDGKEVHTHLEIPPALEGVYDPLQYSPILWPRWPAPRKRLCVCSRIIPPQHPGASDDDLPGWMNAERTKRRSAVGSAAGQCHP